MSEFIAKQHVPSGDPGRGVYAYAKGDRVPADAVKANGWEDYVVGAGTKEARQILAALTGEQVEETTTSSTSTTNRRNQQEG